MARIIMVMYVYLACVSVMVCPCKIYGSKGWSECLVACFLAFVIPWETG
jgi:hypothetical protein